MANRNYNRVQALEKETKILFASVVIGATGAVGTVKGLKSVVRNSAGNYTLELPDKFSRFLGASRSIMHVTNSGIASIETQENPSTFQANFVADSKVDIQCRDYTGAAADPASGTVLSFTFFVRNSSVTAGND